MRLDHLAGSVGPMVVSIEGALPTTLSVLGGPPAGVQSSKDTQASLDASWVTPSEAERASEACSGESKVIVVELF